MKPNFLGSTHTLSQSKLFLKENLIFRTFVNLNFFRNCFSEKCRPIGCKPLQYYNVIMKKYKYIGFLILVYLSCDIYAIIHVIMINKENYIKSFNESLHENNNIVDKLSRENRNTKRKRHTNLSKLTNMELYEIIKDLANTKSKVRINQKYKIKKKIKFASSLDAMEPFIINEEKNEKDNSRNTKFHSCNEYWNIRVLKSVTQ
ncbi:hypothetical protein H8356DRAFT_1354329 [Neocallimastix lanati (nom. inval.)]|nr:hypothetical protein H8356DRAFT_1354329 [Neocallimastix sp. JGI-2020a]